MIIINGVSHLDHGLPAPVIEWLKFRFLEEKTPPFETVLRKTVEIPRELGMVSCGLVGPIVGDGPIPEADVFYRVRYGRKYASRMALQRKYTGRFTHLLSVIAGPYEWTGVPSMEYPNGMTHLEPCVLYTAFGGPIAPREVGDTSIETWSEYLDSREFWKVHALAAGGVRFED